MISVGIDAGSRAIKMVLFDSQKGEVIHTSMASQGVKQDRKVDELYRTALLECSLSEESIGSVVATGYGRNKISFATKKITEITCHAKGVHHLVPHARSIVEIGGQDSKVIPLLDGGRVKDFAMNDRCAAGTGRFLEVIADRLETDVVEFGQYALRSTSPAAISSMCVVFAETEIIGLLAGDCPLEDIAAGVQESVAKRILTLAKSMVGAPLVFTGGVALIPGMAEKLAEVFQMEVEVPPMPQFTGALGAALLGC